jgi:hypothetical protein
MLFAALFVYGAAGAQKTQTMEEQKEMKDTVIVDGKLVEVGYKVIAEGVTDGFTKIENGVVKGYKAIENGVVGVYTKIEDKFVAQFLTKDGETVEDAKARLKTLKVDNTDNSRGERTSDTNSCYR